MTLGDALADVIQQLVWRGPNDKPQGRIVLTREQAEEIVFAFFPIEERYPKPEMSDESRKLLEDLRKRWDKIK